MQVMRSHTTRLIPRSGKKITSQIILRSGLRTGKRHTIKFIPKLGLERIQRYMLVQFTMVVSHQDHRQQTIPKFGKVALMLTILKFGIKTMLKTTIKSIPKTG